MAIRDLAIDLTDDNIDLSDLQEEHGELSREYNHQKAVYREALNKMAAIKPRLIALGQRIQKKKENLQEPIVSDHAIRRYFERCKGFDIEQVKRDILLGHDHEAIIDRNVVVTVITQPGQKQ